MASQDDHAHDHHHHHHDHDHEHDHQHHHHDHDHDHNHGDSTTNSWVGPDGKVYHSHDGLAPHSHEPIYSPGYFSRRAPPQFVAVTFIMGNYCALEHIKRILIMSAI